MSYSADGTRLFSCGSNKEGGSFLVEWNESEGVVKRTYHGLGKRSVGVVQFDTTKNRFLAAAVQDPQTNKYVDQRPSDGSVPPKIPPEFLTLVHSALEDSHSATRLSNSKPPFTFSPDICIVNFYSQNGRLGFHQDKAESKPSLSAGLPVVSFSIGNSAEFLYGGGRDVDKANKVVLESGDVLIFGGKARNVFHGVSAIKPDSAPISLITETNLRNPGRLNLTFMAVLS
ncbi:uncharacterized protein LOC127081105 [Lathyrus oleraceus]|uniref:Fe2OG dioxygenase domain-containing protein n=1 Tax=Pisum sativum TaxID=3888 RepID=A0A9D4WXM5_PEA|nr:uncharacterized protein LOC127081105 [Pisum sativum]KAI5409774.1 hypothetical protein KIW84_055287 [Pisum sativum]